MKKTATLVLLPNLLQSAHCLLCSLSHVGTSLLTFTSYCQYLRMRDEPLCVRNVATTFEMGVVLGKGKSKYSGAFKLSAAAPFCMLQTSYMKPHIL